MLILINEQVWRSLSADHQRILQEAAVEAQKAILTNAVQQGTPTDYKKTRGFWLSPDALG